MQCQKKTQRTEPHDLGPLVLHALQDARAKLRLLRVEEGHVLLVRLQRRQQGHLVPHARAVDDGVQRRVV